MERKNIIENKLPSQVNDSLLSNFINDKQLNKWIKYNVFLALALRYKQEALCERRKTYGCSRLSCWRDKNSRVLTKLFCALVIYWRKEGGTEKKDKSLVKLLL